MRSVRQNYNGRRIELRAPEGEAQEARERNRVLLIDDEGVAYGQLPDGRYFLDDYAYDWRDSLVDLARAFIDYRRKTDEVRRARAESDRAPVAGPKRGE